MMALVPVIGKPLQRLVIGGSEYGHQTLTRFFALHAGVLPGLLTIFLVLHVLLFRRHGLNVRDPNRAPDTTFWPEQLLRDAVACLAVAIVVLVLVLWNYPRMEPGSRSQIISAPSWAHRPIRRKVTRPPGRKFTSCFCFKR